MAGIFDWARNFFRSSNTVQLDGYFEEVSGEVFYKTLAIQACINLVSNTISKSEFLTYEKGKEVRKKNYYLLNIEPNQNKSSSKFWRDVIHKLIFNNECLVIQQDEKLYVADEFTTLKYVFKENVYKDISIDNYQLKNIYTESQVFHFELHDEKVKNVIDGLYESYSKLIKISQSNYKKNNARRGTLEIPTNYPQTDLAQNDLTDLLEKRFKRFFNAEGGAVIPLTNGLKYEELASEIGAKSSGVAGRDIRAFIDDIFDFTAIGFQIPPQLIKGNIIDTDEAVNNLLTFCVNPIAKLLTDEINRKLYGEEHYLQKTYAKLDTTRVKSVDITDIARALDVLLRTGSYTINDCLRELGKEEINDDFGNRRFMTKNYAPVEEVLKGGE